MTLSDNSPMPIGKQFKGVAMANVPDYHLKWWYEKLLEKKNSGQTLFKNELDVLEYIQDYGVENLQG